MSFPDKVNKLQSLKDWIAGCKRQPKSTLRTDKQRKRWIKENYPSVKFVKHPQSGIESIAVEQDMLMLVGERKSVGRVKQEEHMDKKESKVELANAKERIRVNSNTKARAVSIRVLNSEHCSKH